MAGLACWACADIDKKIRQTDKKRPMRQFIAFPSLFFLSFSLPSILGRLSHR
jgi:hypothetical protein